MSDFGAKCEKCETINTITLEKGELKKTSIIIGGIRFSHLYFVAPNEDLYIE
jgi:hypothetical protein